MNNNKIINLQTPINFDDATNKNYVDTWITNSQNFLNTILISDLIADNIEDTTVIIDDGISFITGNVPWDFPLNRFTPLWKR